MTWHAKLVTMWLLHVILLVLTATELSVQAILISLCWAKIQGQLGNEIGQHRLWSHGSFTTGAVWRWILLILSTPLLTGSVWVYAMTHRLHHKRADQDLDPHRVSSWWQRAMHFKTPRPHLRGETIRDLLGDRVLAAQHRYYFWINGTVCAIVGLTLGCTAVVYVITIPVIWNWLIIACVNTLSHDHAQPAAKPGHDHSQNHWALAWLTQCHHLHRNHHEQPARAGFACRPGEWDLAGWLIARVIASPKKGLDH